LQRLNSSEIREKSVETPQTMLSGKYLLDTNPAGHYLNKATNDTNLSFPPRKFASDSALRNHSSAEGGVGGGNSRVLGSGFRVQTAGPFVDGASDRYRIISPPASQGLSVVNFSRSQWEKSRSTALPYHDNGYRMDQFFDDENDFKEVGEKPRAILYEQDSIDDTPSLLSVRVKSGNRAIEAMHEQLITENLLPSMEPERVLTIGQLSDLGLKKKSIDEIAEEIDHHKHYPSKVSSTLSTTREIQMPSLSSYDEKGERLKSNIFLDTELNYGIDEVSLQSEREDQLFPIQWDYKQSHISDKNNKPLPLYGSRLSPLKKDSFGSQTPQFLDINNTSKPSSRQNNNNDSSRRSTPNMPIPQISRKFSGDSRPGSKPNNIYHNHHHHQSESSLFSENSITSRINILAPKIDAFPPPSLDKKSILTGNKKVKPPVALKTKEERENGEGLERFPSSPFKTFAEKSKVMNTGIPAGAGMMLWRPKHKITKDGRYRVGMASSLNDKLYSDQQIPFFNIS
jgi:hypothetical protein